MKPALRRWILIGLVMAGIAFWLAQGFQPKPVLVDMATVTTGPMRLTLDAEGRTEVRDRYTVSMPVAGRLQRLVVRAGDRVVGGETVVARILPAEPELLDSRARLQALDSVRSAEAGVEAAKADLAAAEAQSGIAATELYRARVLADRGASSAGTLDRAEAEMREREAGLRQAHAALAIRAAELSHARNALSRIDAALDPAEGDVRNLLAPVTGRILTIAEESETTLAPGTVLMSIGDPENDLEVIVPLLSSDAVAVRVGNLALIEDWGGDRPLRGHVREIAPSGQIKVTALGVEERRVDVHVALDDAPEARQGLGDGFRVTGRIVLWQSPQARLLPSAALVRTGGDWAVFAVEAGRARLVPVKIGHDNGETAELLDGLAEGGQIVLYPPADLADAMPVAAREG